MILTDKRYQIIFYKINKATKGGKRKTSPVSDNDILYHNQMFLPIIRYHNKDMELIAEIFTGIFITVMVWVCDSTYKKYS